MYPLNAAEGRYKDIYFMEIANVVKHRPSMILTTTMMMMLKTTDIKAEDKFVSVLN
jgi:hypothetical protein